MNLPFILLSLWAVCSNSTVLRGLPDKPVESISKEPDHREPLSSETPVNFHLPTMQESNNIHSMERIEMKHSGNDEMSVLVPHLTESEFYEAYKELSTNIDTFKIEDVQKILIQVDRLRREVLPYSPMDDAMYDGRMQYQVRAAYAKLSPRDLIQLADMLLYLPPNSVWHLEEIFSFFDSKGIDPRTVMHCWINEYLLRFDNPYSERTIRQTIEDFQMGDESDLLNARFQFFWDQWSTFNFGSVDTHQFKLSEISEILKSVVPQPPSSTALSMDGIIHYLEEKHLNLNEDTISCLSLRLSDCGDWTVE
jgi:hypothetical protein